jgi:AcrR family transcriptional regulator
MKDGSYQQMKLNRLALTAADIEKSKGKREREIIAASKAGISLRRIAKAAGMSHEHVRRILKAAS